MGDVLEMKTKRPLFNGELRDQLVTHMSEHVPENPEKVVDQVEDIVCSHLVLGARSAGEKLAAYVFNKLFKS